MERSEYKSQGCFVGGGAKGGGQRTGKGRIRLYRYYRVMLYIETAVSVNPVTKFSNQTGMLHISHKNQKKTVYRRRPKTESRKVQFKKYTITIIPPVHTFVQVHKHVHISQNFTEKCYCFSLERFYIKLYCSLSVSGMQ